MTYKDDLAYAEANLRTVERLRASSRSPIERRNLQSRSDELEQQVRVAEQRLESFAEVELLFDGAPVRAQVGIEAGFAGEGLKSFQDYISTVAAAKLGELGQRGPLPQGPRLMVTGTGAGSFGFHLQEVADQQRISPSPLKVAVGDAIGLMTAATRSDDEFAEALALQDPRVSVALKNFLVVVHRAGATLKIHASRASVRLSSPEELKETLDRVENTRVSESEETREGVLYGWRLGHGDFELKLDDGEIISGRVEGQPLLERGAPLLMQRVVASLRVVTVERAGRSRPGWWLRGLEALTGS